MESHHITGVIEISKGDTAKLEIGLDEPHNPVLSDTNKNKETGLLQLRHYGMPATFNYGFIPQTWENPEDGGDNDPIDLVDLSTSSRKPLLAVADYVILGCLGLIDQGEIKNNFAMSSSWKNLSRSIFLPFAFFLKIPKVLFGLSNK